MTTVELKKTKIAEAFAEMGLGIIPEVTYGTMMVGKLNQPGQGFTVKEMDRRGNIIKTIEAAQENGDNTVELEEDQFTLVKELCVGTTWPIIHDDYKAFEEYLNSL